VHGNFRLAARAARLAASAAAGAAPPAGHDQNHSFLICVSGSETNTRIEANPGVIEELPLLARVVVMHASPALPFPETKT